MHSVQQNLQEVLSVLLLIVRIVALEKVPENRLSVHRCPSVRLIQLMLRIQAFLHLDQFEGQALIFL